MGSSGRLGSILKNRAPHGDPSACADAGLLCAIRHRPLASVGFYSSAFPAGSEPDGSLRRFIAAVSALRSVADRGPDAADLAPEETAHLRRLALDWLRADLAAWGKRAAADAEARADLRERLPHW